ncbi:unnamed protein product, partial [Symbiodinium pilosum]
ARETAKGLSLVPFSGFIQRLAPYLSVSDYTGLRATCSSVQGTLHTKALLSHLVYLMQPERPDVFAATGKWCNSNCSEQFWESLEEGPRLRAGKAGLWIFFRAMTRWRKLQPAAMVPVAKSMRSHCFHEQPDIAKSSQRILAVCAGCLFAIRGQGAGVKGVRHLFARDIIYWLQHGDANIRMEICCELARCGPDLLGRFNKACARGLLDACNPPNDAALRRSARKALKVFVENDQALHPFVRPQLNQLIWHPWLIQDGDERFELIQMETHIDFSNFRKFLWQAVETGRMCLVTSNRHILKA